MMSLPLKGNVNITFQRSSPKYLLHWGGFHHKAPLQIQPRSVPRYQTYTSLGRNSQRRQCHDHLTVFFFLIHSPSGPPSYINPRYYVCSTPRSMLLMSPILDTFYIRAKSLSQPASAIELSFPISSRCSHLLLFGDIC